MQLAMRQGSLFESLDELFEYMVWAAGVNDWLTCDKVCESFAVALEVHLRYEETVQFPRYAATSERAAAEVRQLVADHQDIRRAFGRLMADFKECRLDQRTVDNIVGLMRDHDARESLHFLVWLAQFGRG